MQSHSPIPSLPSKPSVICQEQHNWRIKDNPVSWGNLTASSITSCLYPFDCMALCWCCTVGGDDELPYKVNPISRLWALSTVTTLSALPLRSSSLRTEATPKQSACRGQLFTGPHQHPQKGIARSSSCMLWSLHCSRNWLSTGQGRSQAELPSAQAHS